MAQERIRKTKSASSGSQETVEETKTASKDEHELIEHTDDLLDAIDSILEENAEEFVRGYVQKGGQ